MKRNGTPIACTGECRPCSSARWATSAPIPPSTMPSSSVTVTVTLEDGIVDGGIGALVAQRALEHGLHSPVHAIGVPLRFIQHSSRTEILEDLGLRAGDVARDVLAIVARLQTGSD